MSDFEYMNECMTKDLALLLMEEYNYSIQEALNVLINSKTYEKLLNIKTGLYFQSPVYVYDFLKTELTTGKMG